MEIVAILIIIGVVFCICFLVDKLFTKLFRNKEQHKSGKAVRLNKKNGAFGLIMILAGTAAIFSGVADSIALLLGGVILVLVGIALVVYYLSFGVFYDEEQFVLTTFGKRSQTYYYKDILAQQLYTSYGNTLIELHLSDGRCFQLQSGMDGVYPFLDKAFCAWLRQTGRKREDCTFYDPDNSCWFPGLEK